MKKALAIIILLCFILCSCDAVGNDTQSTQFEGETTQYMEGSTEGQEIVDDSEIIDDGKTTDSDKKDTEVGQPIVLTVSENTAWSALISEKDIKNGCTVNGASPSIRLTLPKSLNMQGDLTFSNITLVGDSTTIYANGFKLKIDSNVSTSSRDDRLTVYGGSAKGICAETRIELLGGYYKNIYGGGYGFGVSGSTNVIFGGNANFGDSNDDDSSDISPCTVYGGGYNAAVNGSTNVTICGAAVAKFVSGVGTGSGGAMVSTANINIKGGKLMNVFGGSLNADVTNLDVSIVMSGGLCESIFGGCQGKNMSGTVDIQLIGGDISRRVYTGCYNDCDVGIFSNTWKTSCKVTGTTTLSIGPNIKLCTATGLSSSNKVDMGVFCGSRYNSAMSEENNILIFLDGCYESMIGKIGPSSSSWWNLCESHHSEIIKK